MRKEPKAAARDVPLEKVLDRDKIARLRVFQRVVDDFALPVHDDGAVLSDEARECRTQACAKDVLDLLHAATSGGVGLR